MEAHPVVDSQIVKWLNGGVGHFPPWDAFMKALVSDYLVPVVGGLALLGLWFWGSGGRRFGNQMAAVAAGGAMGFASLATMFINGAYFRDRPFVDHDLSLLFYQPTDSSFPSNPAAVAFAIATAVFLAHRRMGLALFVLAFLWAFSRVYAGVHYPSDVLAGASLGIVMALVVRAWIWTMRPLGRLIVYTAKGLYLA